MLPPGMKWNPYEYLNEDAGGLLDDKTRPKDAIDEGLVDKMADAVGDAVGDIASHLVPFNIGGDEGDDGPVNTELGDWRDPRTGKRRKNAKNHYGVLQRIADRHMRKEQIYREGSIDDRAYYRYKNIEDLGFKKWAEAYDQAFKWIRRGSFVSFKAWRMSYSFFLGSKQFFCIFQKKKFKKQIVSTTMVSMFMSELLMIVCALVGLIDFKPFDQ
jgi:hypothetical protein